LFGGVTEKTSPPMDFESTVQWQSVKALDKFTFVALCEVGMLKDTFLKELVMVGTTEDEVSTVWRVNMERTSAAYMSWHGGWWRKQNLCRRNSESVSDELWIERGTEQNMKENKHTHTIIFLIFFWSLDFMILVKGPNSKAFLFSQSQPKQYLFIRYI
jgi:hypothetical protein